MTASQVGGVQVVATEAVASKWVDMSTGKPRMYRSVVRLLLEDGRELYGCNRCEYTAAKVTSVAAHQRAHTPRRPAPPPAPAPATLPTPPPAARPPAAPPPLPRVELRNHQTIRGRPAMGDRARAVKAEAALFRIREMIDDLLGPAR